MTQVDGAWLRADGTQRVMALLTDAGHQALAVGGCVRNALLDVPVSDVDLATDALPKTVMELARAAGLKPVPTGLEHGTVTIVADGVGYEVTTFRKDVETDGRRAVVRFSTDIRDDALRRDFTMNALYARADGTVIDPLGGLPDLEARRVRFIEDAAKRIQEDYLRILRFFRFAAWYGDLSEGFDAEALAAIADNLDGLDKLSRERVGAELLRLLAAPDPVIAVSVMAQIGVLHRLLPGGDPRALGPLVDMEQAHALPGDPVRRFVALGVSDDVDLRLSKDQQRRIALLKSLVGSAETAMAMAYRHGADTARAALVLRAAMLETPADIPALASLEEAARQRCPVTARDLMPRYTGPALGARLRALEAAWIASGFALDKAALLALPDGD